MAACNSVVRRSRFYSPARQRFFVRSQWLKGVDSFFNRVHSYPHLRRLSSGNGIVVNGRHLISDAIQFVNELVESLFILEPVLILSHYSAPLFGSGRELAGIQ